MSNTRPTNHPTDFLLSDLRKDCKAKGIKVKKESLSHGDHISFIIDGHNCNGSVAPVGFYQKNKEAVDALDEIKKKYYGKTLNGYKVYGLKP